MIYTQYHIPYLLDVDRLRELAQYGITVEKYTEDKETYDCLIYKGKRRIIFCEYANEKSIYGFYTIGNVDKIIAIMIKHFKTPIGDEDEMDPLTELVDKEGYENFDWKTYLSNLSKKYYKDIDDVKGMYHQTKFFEG